MMQPGTTSEPHPTDDAFTVDLAARKAIRDGAEIRLTPLNGTSRAADPQRRPTGRPATAAARGMGPSTGRRSAGRWWPGGCWSGCGRCAARSS